MRDPISIIRAWQKFFNLKNLKIVNTYSGEGVLIPFFSKQIKIGRNSIQNYYQKLFLKYPSLSVEFKDDFHVSIIDEVNFILSGIYVINYEVGDRIIDQEIKFSFIVSNNAILNHHESTI